MLTCKARPVPLSAHELMITDALVACTFMTCCWVAKAVEEMVLVRFAIIWGAPLCHKKRKAWVGKGLCHQLPSAITIVCLTCEFFALV